MIITRLSCICTNVLPHLFTWSPYIITELYQKAKRMDKFDINDSCILLTWNTESSLAWNKDEAKRRYKWLQMTIVFQTHEH